MLSPRRSISPDSVTNRAEIDAFVALNQEVFQFLLAFVRMSKDFKFSFAEINFPPDHDLLIAALAEQANCQDIQFGVINFDNPDLHFLLSELTIFIGKIEQVADKKLVLIVRGLEKSIRATGDYPPVLTNLNYARDNFPAAIPHPVIFLLPDYAVTRIAQFAPDFWAWTAATFKFQTTQTVLNRAIDRIYRDLRSDSGIARTYAPPERSDRIDLLERLLHEYPGDTEASSRARLEILNQLGEAHKSTRDFEAAKIYFQEALELSQELDYQAGIAATLYDLGGICYYLRNFEEADVLLKQSLTLKEKIGDRQSMSNNYHFLGMVAEGLRKWDEARANYDQALAIKEEFGDRYSQSITYHNLGIVADKLREWNEARANYVQALAIKEEFGDRYKQASTYYQLGRVAQQLCEWDEARTNYLQDLAILVEFGDRYEQGNTYGQLGLLAHDEGNLDEAIKNLLRALEIFAEFQDEHSISLTIENLARISQFNHSEELISAVAKILGVGIANVQQLFTEIIATTSA